MARNYKKNRTAEYSTTLGRATKLSGKLTYTESLRINGIFEGEIVSEGSLYIAEGAKVKADITAETVILGGTVYGDVVASGKIELLSTCRLFGDIKAPCVRIADGVVFKGKCEMIKDPDTIDIFAAPIETLKKTVSGA
ncbi:MAG: polymer-forming cytoskeletal protein [Spirochaetaceae bacterium]